jgi:hypothetical protein
MRAYKLREEVAKDRDEHFNVIRPMILANPEWRVEEKTSVHSLTASDDDMDLLDDDESPLIMDGSPPPASLDVNMVFTLPAEFRGAEEEIAQLCLGPKEAMFENPEELSQRLKSSYVQGHIDGWLISRMLIDSSAVINLMSYSLFRKLGREDGELVKTNPTLNGGGGGGGQPNGG